MRALFAPLGERLSNRDNNLNLIRMLAATAVLVSHAFPIALGPDAPEPLQALVGHSLGHIAVLVFFAASGFLIAASYQRRHSLSAFCRARAARLLPGLAVSVVLVALVMGPVVTTLPAASYIAHPETWTFIARNILMVRVQYSLPGVFESNPYSSVEGSIWTLLYEVCCYAGVVIAGTLGLLAHRGIGTLALCLYLAVAVALPSFGGSGSYQLDLLLMLSRPFVLGMLMYLWRDRLPLNPLIAVGLGVLAALAPEGPVYESLLVAAISYGTIAFAVWPDGAIRAYNRLGDYSYGIYIYAFPIQGLAVWAAGPQSPIQNMLLAFPPTLALAVLSWHLVEKPALAWGRGTGTTSRRGTVPAAGQHGG